MHAALTDAPTMVHTYAHTHVDCVLTTCSQQVLSGDWLATAPTFTCINRHKLRYHTLKTLSIGGTLQLKCIKNLKNVVTPSTLWHSPRTVSAAPKSTRMPRNFKRYRERTLLNYYPTVKDQNSKSKVQYGERVASRLFHISIKPEGCWGNLIGISMVLDANGTTNSPDDIH